MGKNNLDRVKVVGVFVALGAVAGGVDYWMVSSCSVIAWITAGGLVGVVVGLLWPSLRSFAVRHRLEDWRLEEVKIGGATFTSAGAQRRTAWRLFVEMATRIAVQPMKDEDGDDGVALKSLYDLFQVTRKEIAEMQLTPNATGDTVETFALEMLNLDLRPFLSRWHPQWDEFAKTGAKDSKEWSKHSEFRKELKDLQTEITKRAKGLAQIAGVKEVDRFFEPPKKV